MEAKTSQFHLDKIDNRLIHSYIGKHKPVYSSTIAKWLKTRMIKIKNLGIEFWIQ